LLGEEAVVDLALVQEAEQEVAWLGPTAKLAKALEAWVDLSPPAVWVGQQMAKALQALKVIGESEALEDMVPCMAVVEAAVVTTAVAAAVQTLTLVAPMPAVEVVDLHTPTQIS
jgi:hypothetical protein